MIGAQAYRAPPALPLGACKHLIIQTQSFWSNRIYSLKYQRSKTFGCTNRDYNLDFVAIKSTNNVLYQAKSKYLRYKVLNCSYIDIKN